MHTHFAQEHFKFLKLAFVPIQPMTVPSFICTTLSTSAMLPSLPHSVNIACFEIQLCMHPVQYFHAQNKWQFHIDNQKPNCYTTIVAKPNWNFAHSCALHLGSVWQFDSGWFAICHWELQSLHECPRCKTIRCASIH